MLCRFLSFLTINTPHLLHKPNFVSTRSYPLKPSKTKITTFNTTILFQIVSQRKASTESCQGHDRFVSWCHRIHTNKELGRNINLTNVNERKGTTCISTSSCLSEQKPIMNSDSRRSSTISIALTFKSDFHTLLRLYDNLKRISIINLWQTTDFILIFRAQNYCVV